MDDSDVQRELGRFEAKIAALESSVATLHQSVEALNETIISAKGSWRALMWLGGAASVAGASIYHLFDLLVKGVK